MIVQQWKSLFSHDCNQKIDLCHRANWIKIDDQSFICSVCMFFFFNPLWLRKITAREAVHVFYVLVFSRLPRYMMWPAKANVCCQHYLSIKLHCMWNNMAQSYIIRWVFSPNEGNRNYIAARDKHEYGTPGPRFSLNINSSSSLQEFINHVWHRTEPACPGAQSMAEGSSFCKSTKNKRI